MNNGPQSLKPNWLALLLLLAVVCLLSFSSPAVENLKREIKVTWDFGPPPPGRGSEREMGGREISVKYSSSECLSRFTLESIRYELVQVVDQGDTPLSGPPFIILQFRKHFAGDFGLLPKVTFNQKKVDKWGHATGLKAKVVFPFREKGIAAPISDPTASEIDIFIGAPGSLIGLANPLMWFDITVSSD